MVPWSIFTQKCSWLILKVAEICYVIHCNEQNKRQSLNYDIKNSSVSSNPFLFLIR